MIRAHPPDGNAPETGRHRAAAVGEHLQGVLQLVLDLVRGEDQDRRREDDEAAAVEEPDDRQHDHEERAHDLGLTVVAHLGQHPHRRVQPVRVRPRQHPVVDLVVEAVGVTRPVRQRPDQRDDRTGAGGEHQDAPGDPAERGLQPSYQPGSALPPRSRGRGGGGPAPAEQHADDQNGRQRNEIKKAEQIHRDSRSGVDVFFT